MAKRIVVLGAGESGVGAAILAQKKGFEVFVSDMSMIKDKYKNMLVERGIEWEEGQHTESLILNADEAIKSPGIPNNAPMIVKLKDLGVPVISEIEFAGRYTNAQMICITGSNGKTTTTSLIYHIFKKAGLNVGLAGNIGRSLALQVAECNYDYYVIELSSFQLDNMYRFACNYHIGDFCVRREVRSKDGKSNRLRNKGTVCVSCRVFCCCIICRWEREYMVEAVSSDGDKAA